MLILTIGGVYAEDIDSSVLTESSNSADVDTILSSSNDFNNDLSNNLQHSDSLSYSESFDFSSEESSRIDDESVNRFVTDIENVKQISTSIDGINISVIALNLNNGDTILSEVTHNIETSESYKFIRNVTQANNLTDIENIEVILVINGAGMPNYQVNEFVFDDKMVFEYISNYEVYFGIKSKSDFKKLFNSIGAFTNLTGRYSGFTFALLKSLNEHELEDFLEDYNFNKIHYYSLIDGEDKYNHVNDFNSRDLDYAYYYKNMLNLLVSNSSSNVFTKEYYDGGFSDSLNDVLGAEVSSETLLPDHKAIWTPLLFVQHDSTESILKSHADDNEIKNKVNNANKFDNNSTNKSNSSNKSHHKSKHYHKYWTHGGSYSNYIAGNVVSEVSLDKNQTKNETDSNNTDVKSNEKQQNETPKTNVNHSKPTYTLVYAIIGILFVSFLFYSSYIKRDD